MIQMHGNLLPFTVIAIFLPNHRIMQETTSTPQSEPASGVVNPGYAGFWMRLVAYIIDYLLLSFVLGIIITILAVIFGLSLESWDDPDDVAAQIMIASTVFGLSLGAVVVIWLYFALMESGKNQATLGKMVLNIKVTDMAGNRISFGRATVRFFSKIISSAILYIGYIMIGFTERQQGLHDMIAGCLVVKK